MRGRRVYYIQNNLFSTFWEEGKRGIHQGGVAVCFQCGFSAQESRGFRSSSATFRTVSGAQGTMLSTPFRPAPSPSQNVVHYCIARRAIAVVAVGHLVEPCAVVVARVFFGQSFLWISGHRAGLIRISRGLVNFSQEGLTRVALAPAPAGKAANLTSWLS